MKRIILFLVLYLTFSVSVAYAESISAYGIKILVNTDNSITVTETIDYDFENEERHGIFRTIPLISTGPRSLRITDVLVTDKEGNQYTTEVINQNGETSIRIGDADKYVTGKKTYVIYYTAQNAVAHLEAYDEIYWNATGDKWSIPIQNVSIEVILPENTPIIQEVCYVGIYASQMGCTAGDVYDGYFTMSMLPPGVGVTVAVGFPDGIVMPYEKTFYEKYTKEIHIAIIIGSILLPLLVFFFWYRYWRKKGRDPKDHPVIIPEYTVPDSLTPLEAGTIVYEKTKSEFLSAHIIYLATKGYIVIHQRDSKILGISTGNKYDLEYKKSYESLAGDPLGQKILSDFFEGKAVGDKVPLDSVSVDLYVKNLETLKEAKKVVIQKGYFTVLKDKIGYGILGGLGVIILCLIPILTIDYDIAIFIIPTISILVAVVISVIFYNLLSVITTKGLAARKHLLGLKQYLQIAEKDRLAFHNAPEKKPEVFETLLPYAMIFGVEKAWAKEFENIYTISPSWYHGNTANAFSAIAFTNSINSFSTYAQTSTLPSSSGGSGGGGFSGGGGGGGGGGSW